MIVKGKPRANAAQLAAYLLATDKNERVDVLQVRGVASTDLRGALEQMEAVAAGTRCRLPLYHAQLRAAPGEHLTAAQWERSADILADKLGMADHARTVVLHTKDGHRHAHVVFGRIDPATMRAAHTGHSYVAHEATARQIERECGLKHVPGVHVGCSRGAPRPERTPDSWEIRQGDRIKIDTINFRQTMRDLYARSDSGLAFVAALPAHGVTLCQGDRRDFVLLDAAGGVHSLSRTLGLKAGAVRAYLADIDRDTLPTVAAARAGLHRQPHVITTIKPPEARQQTRGRRKGATDSGSGRTTVMAIGAQLATTRHHHYPRRHVAAARPVVPRLSRPAIIRLTGRYAVLNAPAPENSRPEDVNQMARRFRHAFREAVQRDTQAVKTAERRGQSDALARHWSDHGSQTEHIRQMREAFRAERRAGSSPQRLAAIYRALLILLGHG